MQVVEVEIIAPAVAATAGFTSLTTFGGLPVLSNGAWGSLVLGTYAVGCGSGTALVVG